MKTTTGIIRTFAITTLSITCFACNAQKKNIAIKELPATAQSFIKTNFPNQAASYIIEDKDLTSTEYDVQFMGGAEIEFDSNGNWKEVDANKSLMPATVLPKNIAAYIAKNYKGQQVEKIEKKRRGYKVEFVNDLELEFDTNGNFLRIDD